MKKIVESELSTPSTILAILGLYEETDQSYSNRIQQIPSSETVICFWFTSDVVILNTLENPVMKYHIVAEGELLTQQPGYTSLVEPKILNGYFDFQIELQKNGLTA